MFDNWSNNSLIFLAMAVFFLNVPIAWVFYFAGLYLVSMTIVSIGTFLVFLIFYELETRDRRPKE